MAGGVAGPAHGRFPALNPAQARDGPSTAPKQGHIDMGPPPGGGPGYTGPSIAIIRSSDFDTPDDLERSWAVQFSRLQDALASKPEGASGKHLHRLTEAPQVHTDMTTGLVFGILGDAANTAKYMGLLVQITRDAYASALGLLTKVALDKYPKLLDQARGQLLWVLRELLALRVPESESLLLAIMRQIAGGDLSPPNVWLATAVLDLVKTNRLWLLDRPGVPSMLLYHFLRLIPDHARNSMLADLKAQEVALCLFLFRERPGEALAIGRDLVRAMQEVSKLPEFEGLWRDLLYNLGAFHVPGMADLADLLHARTPSRYLVSRLTPDMEAQLRFVMSQVKMGNQRRYQQWFGQRFLAPPESDSLLCDLIRFICGVYHPSNQLLSSDIVPRWAIIGWLLRCARSAHTEVNAKLALFYDWFFFVPKTDNIMNIEPAILLMVHSIPKYMDITHSLLEFLFLMVDHYDPARRELLHRGVVASLSVLVGKGVIRSLDVLTQSNYIDPVLRDKVRAVGAFVRGGEQPEPKRAKLEGPPHLEATHRAPGTRGGAENGAATAAVSHVEAERREPTLLQRLMRLQEAASSGVTGDVVAALSELLAAFNSSAARDAADGPGGWRSGDDAGGRASPLSVDDLAQEIVNVLDKPPLRLFGEMDSLPPINETAETATECLLRACFAQAHVAHSKMVPLVAAIARLQPEGVVSASALCYAAAEAELEAQLARERRVNVETSLAGIQAAAGDAPGKALPTLKVQPRGSAGDKSSPQASPRANSEQMRAWTKFLVPPNAGKANGAPAAAERATSVHASPTSSSPSLPGGNRLDVNGVRAFACYRELNLAIASSSGATKAAGSVKLEDASADEAAGPESPIAAAKVCGKGGAAENTVAVLLEKDIRVLLGWSMYLMLSVLRSVFRLLPNASVGNITLARYLVSSLDSVECLRYCCGLSLAEFEVFGEDPEDTAGIVRESLRWESWEQSIVWRLLDAELGARSDAVFHKLAARALESAASGPLHPDALLCAMPMITSRRPSERLLRVVLERAEGLGDFPATILARWAASYPDELLRLMEAWEGGKGASRSLIHSLPGARKVLDARLLDRIFASLRGPASAPAVDMDAGRPSGSEGVSAADSSGAV